MAQQATELQGVEVTGSHIRRVDSATSDTVQVLDRKQILATGSATLGELIQSVPALGGALTNSVSNNDPSTGADPFGNADVNLRGLGSVRTLLLVDGRRVNYQDINSIPANMVERVEVLKQGAAAIYGTDAIGGVVNFITRKNFTGIEATGQYGATEYGDAQTTDAELTYGAKAAGGNVMFGLAYNRQTAIAASDRTYSAQPYGFYNGTLNPNQGRSGYSGKGRFFTDDASYTTPDGTNCPGGFTLKDGATGTSADDFRCFSNNKKPGATDRFNFQPYNLDLDPSERYSIFGNAHIPLNDNVSWFASGYFTDTKASFSLAPSPFGTSVLAGTFLDGSPTISGSSVYNPFGTPISSWLKRATSTGPRQATGLSDAFEMSTGFKGTLLDKFDWNTTVSYGLLSQTQTESGILDISTLELGQLGPSFFNADGVAQCGTAAAPIGTSVCKPINVMGTTGNQLSADAVTTNNYTRTSTLEFAGDINGDIFTIPWAGAVGVAAGFELRNLHLDNNPDSVFQLFHADEQNGKATAGSYSVREIYGETHIPLAKDLPGLQSLALNLGVRSAWYSTTSLGSVVDGKYAFEYKPIKDLLLRGTYSDVYRAPNVSELYGGATQSAPAYTDPCNGLTAGAAAAHAKACKNVPTDGTFAQLNSQANAVNVGNALLKPEKGYSTDFGAVWNPSFYSPLTIEADYWRYSIKQYITGISLNQILEACYADNTSPYCGTAPDGQSFFLRAPNGQIANAQQVEVNSDRLYTSGWDFAFKLNYPKIHIGDVSLGSIQLGADVTYLSIWDYKSLDPNSGALLADISNAGVVDTTGVTYAPMPRFKGQGFVFWNYGAFTTSIEDRYVGTVEITSNAINGVGADAVTNQNRASGAANYVDLAETFKWKRASTDLTFGINDLFDQGIVPIYDLAHTGAPLTNYDPRGRNFYGRVTVHFK